MAMEYCFTTRVSTAIIKMRVFKRKRKGLKKIG